MAQALYKRVAIDQMTRPSERPFLLETAGGTWAAIAEAGVEDYPSMFVTTLRAEKHSLVAKMMGAATMHAPFASADHHLILDIHDDFRPTE